METLTTVAPELLEQVIALPKGDYAECGVYWGGSAEQILAKKAKGTVLYLLDSFEGLPDPGAEDNAILSKGKYSATYEDVRARFKGKRGVKVLKGLFSETLSEIPKTKFRFIHLDCDLYQSYKECLEFFLPRMVSGGVILLDDYYYHQGAKKAVEEYLEPSTLQHSTTTERAYWIAP